MLLNKREMAEKLGVSETTMTAWQRAGLPVLAHGSRGKDGSYDLTAVVRWVRETGAGLSCRTGPRVDLDRLERECGLVPPAAPTPQAAIFPDPETIRAVEEAMASSIECSAAIMVRLLNLTPNFALLAWEVAMGQFMSEFDDAFGSGTGPCRTTGDSALLNKPGGRAMMLARIAQRAGDLSADEIKIYDIDEDDA
jgi:hypothetical protein